MFGCIVFCGPEVLERDPQLWHLTLYTLSSGAIGMLSARRRPILSAVFISFILLGAFAVYLEVRNSHASDSILRLSSYISGSALAILVGISMSVLGALVGAKKVDQGMQAWRWTSGGSGIALLGLTLFGISEFVRATYYPYFFVGKKYGLIARFLEMGWQNILGEASIACVLIGLLLLATYLLRSAFRHENNTEIAGNS